MPIDSVKLFSSANISATDTTVTPALLDVALCSFDWLFDDPSKSIVEVFFSSKRKDVVVWVEILLNEFDTADVVSEVAILNNKRVTELNTPIIDMVLECKQVVSSTSATNSDMSKLS